MMSTPETTSTSGVLLRRRHEDDSHRERGNPGQRSDEALLLRRYPDRAHPGRITVLHVADPLERDDHGAGDHQQETHKAERFHCLPLISIRWAGISGPSF